METKLLQDNWSEVRDQFGEWWDDLTDEDLDKVDGDQEHLIRILQERYCYTRNLAILEVEKYMSIHNDPAKSDHSDLRWYEDSFSSISSRNWNENDYEYCRGRSDKSKRRGNNDSPEGTFNVHSKNRIRIASKDE